MKLTKEDYMRLPKERLAELLVERDHEFDDIKVTPAPLDPMPQIPSGWGCDGRVCTNPQMDCINCPRRMNIYPKVYYSEDTNDTKANKKDD